MIQKRVWIVSLSAAVVVHGALASYFWVKPHTIKDVGAMELGTAGTQVGFGMAGTVETRPELSIEKTQQPEAEPEPIEVTKPEPEKPEVKPEPKPVEKPKPVEVTPAPAAIVESIPKPLPEPKTEVFIPVVKETKVEEIKAEPVTQTQVTEKSTPTEPQSEVIPEDKTVAEPKVEPKPVKTNDSQKADKNQQASNQASGTKSQKQTGGGAKKGDAKSYFSNLFAWLLSHQQYPPEVKKQKIEGVAVVLFTFDKNGNVLSKKISTSSGNARLDEEALAMLDRASPLPAIPANLGRDKLTLRFNAEFSLIK